MEPFGQMSYYWSPELGRMFKRFYFTVWPLTKFDSFLFWMIDCKSSYLTKLKK
jgi:hypothetical protein